MAMGWYEGVISMDGRLQGKARSDRRLMFLVSSIIGVVMVIVLLTAPRWPLLTYPLVFLLICNVVIIALSVRHVHLTHNIVRIYIAASAAIIMALDLSMRMIGSPPVWSVFVLLADLSLVIGLGKRFATGLAAVAAVWVAIMAAENVLRFGLYDVPGSVSDSTRWERLQETVQCLHPPCPAKMITAYVEVQVALTVMLVDFGATRGFAESAERKRAAMGRTIETVEAIAQLLAGYDVDTVAEMLQEAEAEGRLPAAIHEALHRLEQNLRAYRPYLPKSCLPAQKYEGSDDCPSVRRSPETDSINSNSSIIDAVDVPRTGAAKVLGALKTVRAALLVVNTRNALACLEEDPRTFTSFFETLLTNTMSAVESRRGLVDVFVGDRILASFNTSRPCLLHATAAAGAAQQIVQAVQSDGLQRGDSVARVPLRVNIGAASGHVLCGDTGCSEMRRFSLLGVLPVLACGMERAARALGLDVVCNTALRQDAEHEHVLLLVPRMVQLAKADARGGTPLCWDEGVGDALCRVYELVTGTQDTSKETLENGEWMYHIGKGAAEWEPYNAAMRAYLSGTDVKAAAEMAGERHRQAHSTISLLGHTTPLAVYV